MDTKTLSIALARMSLPNWWRTSILGRHADDTKHEWGWGEKTGKHYCEWDYCHCYVQTCATCGKSRHISSGADEIR